jgi:hypothetical protein
MQYINYKFEKHNSIDYGETFIYHNGAFEWYYIKKEPENDIKISCSLCKLENECNEINASLCCGDGYFDNSNIRNEYSVKAIAGACERLGIDAKKFMECLQK